MGPFTVDYIVAGTTDAVAVAKQATFAKPGSHQLPLDVPPPVAATGGSFTVTFKNLKDVNGCTAKTTNQSVTFEVKTTRVGTALPVHGIKLTHHVASPQPNSAMLVPLTSSK